MAKFVGTIFANIDDLRDSIDLDDCFGAFSGA
jgi:hypothetical protein